MKVCLNSNKAWLKKMPWYLHWPKNLRRLNSLEKLWRWNNKLVFSMKLMIFLVETYIHLTILNWIHLLMILPIIVNMSPYLVKWRMKFLWLLWFILKDFSESVVYLLIVLIGKDCSLFVYVLPARFGMMIV